MKKYTAPEMKALAFAAEEAIGADELSRVNTFKFNWSDT